MFRQSAVHSNTHCEARAAMKERSAGYVTTLTKIRSENMLHFKVKSFQCQSKWQIVNTFSSWEKPIPPTTSISANTNMHTNTNVNTDTIVEGWRHTHRHRHRHTHTLLGSRIPKGARSRCPSSAGDWLAPHCWHLGILWAAIQVRELLQLGLSYLIIVILQTEATRKHTHNTHHTDTHARTECAHTDTETHTPSITPY